jgi:hypothetical protein
MMSGLNGYHTTQETATRYGVKIWVVRKLFDRLGIGHRFGRYRVVAEADLPTLEIGLRTLGYAVPNPMQPAAESAP